MSRKKLIITSTRLPVSVSKVNGRLHFSQSTGGLATGVSSVSKSRDSVWVGWPGISSDELTAKDKVEITKELKKYKCHPIFLSKGDVENYYSGYCNATIWPLFHYFTKMTAYEPVYWESYKKVNALFYKEIKQFINDDAQIWVHDYQLMLLPQLIRDKNKEALIGFFLHTPFPSFEIFRLLPERTEILKGLLGASLIGFHTYDYVSHFLTSVTRTVGYENNLGTIDVDGRFVQTDAFPIGIDYDKFAREPKKQKVKKLVKSFDVFDNHKKIILTVDRSDYSKGIPARLDAFELFLRQNPKYLDKVIMILLAVPSREDVGAYQELRETIEQKVSRINGHYSTVDWSPIVYRHQAVPFNELSALYSKADVMLVTPLRDGMNLVAKEYVATHHKSDGVLVLSEMAGVASELTEAIQVNPNDSQMVANAIVQALEMPTKEQKVRMKAMQERISDYTISRWADDYIQELESSKSKQLSHPKKLQQKDIKQLEKDYMSANKRLILLDYDGTLKSFVASPSKTLARPTYKVRSVIKRLTSDKRNRVMIVSGRPKNVLETFFNDKGLGLVAEHGGWIFDAGSWVKSSVTSKKWKKRVKPILEQYASRTPGALVEEKDFSLVWHYRKVSPDLAYVRKEELKMELLGMLGDGEIDVFEGQKVVEVKPRSMHKGAIVTELLSQEKWDFILSIGDDYTDEDMFRTLPDRAYTVHVGSGNTDARYQLDSVNEVVELLQNLKSESKTD